MVDIIWIFFLSAFMTCCTSEDDFPLDKSYPFVLSKIVKIDKGGVIFGGEILNYNEQQINEVGFIVTGISDTPLEIKALEVNEFFEYNLNIDIPEGKTYTFCAFAKSDSITIYGNYITFTSQGFKVDNPQIDSISTIKVTDNSVVKIYGRNFSAFKENINVFIGGHNALINHTSFNEIVFTVPNGLRVGDYLITIAVYNKTASGGNLKIMAPVINDFHPKSGFDGTEITIKGNFFSNNSMITNLFFGDFQIIDYYFVSDSLIIFTTPETLISGNVNIEVDVSGKRVATSENFIIIGHSVSSLNKVSGKVGEIVEISGNNFLQKDRISEVYFNNSLAEISSISNERITCNIPNLDIISNSAVVKVINGTKEVIATENFTITPTWTTLGKVPFAARANAVNVVIENYGYIGLGQSRWWGEDLQSDWWRYNPNNNSWSELRSYPGELHSRYINFSVKGKCYIGHVSNIDGVYVDLWQYDPQLNNWIKKASLNEQGLSNLEYASVFVHKDLAYFMDLRKQGKMYKYDAKLNKWFDIDIPIFYESNRYNYKPFSLVLNERIYWFFSSRPLYGSTSTINVIEYVPSSNKWNEIISFSNNGLFRNHAMSFKVNDMAFFGGGRHFATANPSSKYFWKFDPVALTLTKVENFNSPVVYQSNLVINNVAYLGLGYDSSLNSKDDFWLFSPN